MVAPDVSSSIGQAERRERRRSLSKKVSSNIENDKSVAVSKGRVEKSTGKAPSTSVTRREERRRVMVEAKAVWEQLRPKAVDKERRSRLVAQLHEQLQGRLVEFVFRHDGSRIVQWMLGDSGEKQRNAILDELLGGFNSERTAGALVSDENIDSATSFLVRLASDRYGRHLVFKLLRVTSKRHRQLIFDNMLRGHVTSLLKNAYGADVLDFAFQTTVNAHQRLELVQEFLFSRRPELLSIVRSKRSRSPDTSQGSASLDVPLMHFASDVGVLGDSFKDSLVESAGAALSPHIEKESTLRLAIVHAALDQYLDVLIREFPRDKVHDFCSILAPSLVHLAHTKPGVHCAVNCVKLVDAKVRKKIIRSLKGHIRQLVVDEHGHRLIIAMMEWTDDTKLVGKTVVAELVSATKIDADIAWQNSEEADAVVSAGKKKNSASKKSKVEIGSGVDKEASDGISGIKIDAEFIKHLFTHKHGRMIFLSLMFPRDTRYFNPVMYGHIWEPIDMEKFGKLSKKDTDLRNAELWDHFRGAVASTIELHFMDLLSCHWSAPVLIGASQLRTTKEVVHLATSRVINAVLSDPGCAVAKSLCAQKTVRTVVKLGRPTMDEEVKRRCGADVCSKLAKVTGWAQVVDALSQEQSVLKHINTDSHQSNGEADDSSASESNPVN